MTMWHMRIAYWIPKVTNTNSDYVILLLFPLQQWLRERASMLRCTYIACLVHRHFSVRITIRVNYFPTFKYSSFLHACYF